MAARAKALKIRKIEGEFRRVAHGLYMVDLKPADGTALYTLELVSP
ncbi:hypothetical protein [Hyphococcus sp.]